MITRRRERKILVKHEQFELVQKTTREAEYLTGVHIRRR